MADALRLTGSYSTTPYVGVRSGIPSVESPIDERVILVNKTIGQYDLTVDTPVPVDLSGLTQVNVLFVKAIGGKIRLRLTSADGSQQAIPVDSFFALISLSTAITAIDLTRTPGTVTTVDIFMGQRA